MPPDTQAEGDVLEAEDLDENLEAEASADEPGEQGADDAPEAVAAEESEPDEVIITIGDEAPPEEEEKRAPDWVRELRKANREKDRRIRELEARVQTAQPAAVQADPVGAKPTLESCDFDGEKLAAELESWYDRKAKAERAADEKRRAEESERAAWQAKLDAYGSAKAKLKVRDYEDAEASAMDVLSVVQQGVILSGAENPARLVYALGKHPSKAKELAAITDPVKFAFAVAKLETQLRTAPAKKAAPTPERVVKSSVAGAAAVDNQLEKLRDEAAKTGDMSKLMAYRQQLKAKQRA